MPELPDITVYLEALERHAVGERVGGIRVASPAVLRTYDPPYDTVVGLSLGEVHRIGKRIVLELEEGLFVVIHLMIAGRLRWEALGKPLPRKAGLAAVDLESGSLMLTEQGTHRRAGLWIVSGWEAVKAMDRGGIDPLTATPYEFDRALRSENRTLKRALTDPRILSGIGNSYSDEILWEARLSPVTRTGRLVAEEMQRLHQATVHTLTVWTERLREEVGDGWPTRVTAFREEMAVHGKYGRPCPRCGHPVQRIVYADNETNYCAVCQTGGKLLADRSLSKLLKGDWPKTVYELDE